MSDERVNVTIHAEDHTQEAFANAAEAFPSPKILNTYNLQVVSPDGEETRLSDTDKRVLADLPAMLEAVEEDLSDLLPEGYSARIREWDSDVA